MMDYADMIIIMRYVADYIIKHGLTDELMRLASECAEEAKEQYLDNIESGCIEF